MDEADWRVCQLLLSGNEPFDAFVAALNAAGQPAAVQEQRLCRTKHRVHAATGPVRKEFAHG